MVECLTMVDGRWGDLLDAERPPAKIGGDRAYFATRTPRMTSGRGQREQ